MLYEKIMMCFQQKHSGSLKNIVSGCLNVFVSYSLITFGTTHHTAKVDNTPNAHIVKNAICAAPCIPICGDSRLKMVVPVAMPNDAPNALAILNTAAPTPALSKGTLTMAQSAAGVE